MNNKLRNKIRNYRQLKRRKKGYFYIVLHISTYLKIINESTSDYRVIYKYLYISWHIWRLSMNRQAIRVVYREYWNTYRATTYRLNFCCRVLLWPAFIILTYQISRYWTMSHMDCPLVNRLLTIADSCGPALFLNPCPFY